MEIIIANKQCRTTNQSTYNKLTKFIKFNPIADSANESDVRKALLPFVEQQLGPNEWIMYDGNSVWDVKRLMKQFRTFVKFYNYEHFTKYLYEFFSLQCGSIAHYNKSGWLSIYPDLLSLKEFFKHNEYGSPVENHPPAWHYDGRLATQEMSKHLLGSGNYVPYPKY